MRDRSELDRLTHVVHCHVCPGGYTAEKQGLPRTIDQHPRYVSRLMGSPEFGGLWHCPAHNSGDDCDCPQHDDWTDQLPSTTQLMRWKRWCEQRSGISL